MKKKVIIGILAVLALGVAIYAGIPAIALKKENINRNVETVHADETQTQVDITGSEFVAAEGEDVKLYFNPQTMGLRVSNAKDGTEWLSYIKGSSSSADKALLNISFLGEDNALYTWDSDTYCTALQSYEVYKIDNGIKIHMDLNQGESNVFYAYLPKKMSIERFENVFKKGLEDAKSAGTISEDEYNRYNTTLGLVYKKSITEECYAVTYTGNPPTSATKQMIAVANIVGYNEEMLTEDADTFGFTLADRQIPEFNLNLYLTLEGDELVAEVPTSEIVTGNDYFKMQNIEVLPNMGASTVSQLEDGYFLIPDGCGALMAVNGYVSGVPNYKRAFYDNDYFSDYYYMEEYGEKLGMPVFGVIYGALDKEKQSFLAIIEEGAQTAIMNTELASTGEDGATNNKAFASFDTSQYMRVKVYGPYSDNSANYLVSTDVMNVNLKIRYQFFGKKQGYYDMASSYRDYLADKWGRELSYRDSAAVHLDVYGALDVTDHVLGIPYNKTISMTKYSELEAMLKELEGKNMSVSYGGALNGGANNDLNDKCSLVSVNGSKKEFNSLKAYAENNGIDLSLSVSPERIYDKSLSYRANKHSVRDYGNLVATISGYDTARGLLSGSVNAQATYYELVSPKYLSDVVNGFLKKSGNVGDLYLGTMGNQYYADYKNSAMISPYDGEKVLLENFEALSENHGLVISDPFFVYAGYGKMLTDISRENSGYTTFTYSVPFKELVLNGLVDYTSKQVNMSSKEENYFVLQAAELGAIPKYTLTYKSEDLLKNSDYTKLYAVKFDNQKESIDRVYSECEEILSRVGTTHITGHKVLAENVYETTYETGVVVKTNYNLYDVTLEDGTKIGALDYCFEGVN
ncbi:DUF5696 domain-containing protein [Butyrivibrio sp. YAB3001]|uniref:DUF5696 domain-containing protein n=1 Tax=Butyrivibrio sp. YAB3001 TaxID=1520812 RepID=UPI0008F66484|nr:DUF5696 domain-containing protein [Butyrivibrio sp. YAB3001]SFC27135.1 hypothetical protein SAMN02910398_01862 [Butyrivibrio sp. YAB3001]